MLRMSSSIWVWRAASALPWLAPLGKTRRSLVWAAAILFAAWTGAAKQTRTLAGGHLPGVVDAYFHEDPDTALILNGLHEAPEFRDTLGWWTGPWCAKIPFWRPIPSMVFWTELQAFGHDFRWWGVVSIVFTCAFAAAMMWGFEPLFGAHGAAAVVFMIFASLWVPWHPPPRRSGTYYPTGSTRSI